MDLKLVRFQGLREVGSGLNRVLRDQQNRGLAERNGLLEANLAQRSCGYLSSQIHCTGCVHAGVHAKVIESGLKLDLAGAQRFSFRGDLDAGRGARRRG